MADFTSVDETTTSVGGDFILVRQGSVDYKLSKENWLNAIYPAGSLYITTNITNPSVLGFPGTWQLVEGDCSLNSVGVADPDLGNVTGTNTPEVPVPQHNHSASFSGLPMATHNHTGTTDNNTHYHLQGESAFYSSRYGQEDTGAAATDGIYRANTNTIANKTSNNTHNHTVTFNPASAGTPSGNVTVSNSGTSGATLNVQGKVLNVLVWLRTA